MKATVIIPTKNEPYLPTLLKQLSNYEVLVQTEPGLANAVLHGVKKAHGEALVVLDADGSHNPKYIPAMLKLLDQGYDIVIGSRYTHGGKTEDTYMRQILSRFFNQLGRVILQINVKDNMSGYIVARRIVFEQFNLKPLGYKILLEILVKNQGRFRVVEFPIIFEKRKLGQSKTGLGQAIKTLTFIIKLKIEALTSK